MAGRRRAAAVAGALHCAGAGAHLREVGDAEHEADAVEDVALPRPVQPRDRVELAIEPADRSPDGVRLEAIEHDLLEVHPRRGQA